MDAFLKLCTWLERLSDLYSISEVHEIMTQLAGCDASVYSEKTHASSASPEVCRVLETITTCWEAECVLIILLHKF